MSCQVCDDCPYNGEFTGYKRCPKAWCDDNDCPYNTAKILYSIPKTKRPDLLQKASTLLKAATDLLEFSENNFASLNNDYRLEDIIKWVEDQFDAEIINEYATKMRDVTLCKRCKQWDNENDVCTLEYPKVNLDSDYCNRFIDKDVID